MTMGDTPDPLAGLPDDRGWTAEVHREALERKRAQGPCEACGADRWGVADETMLVSALDAAGRFVSGRGIDAVAVFCRRCGLLRLHATSVLLKG
jgi:hypothetical protein